MAALLGAFVGGLFIVYVFQLLWEFALFKRVLDDPVKGKIGSTAAAYVTICIIFGFLTARGGPFVPNGFLIYLPPAIVIGAIGAWRGFVLRGRAERLDDIF
jgi:hypothetical protein